MQRLRDVHLFGVNTEQLLQPKLVMKHRRQKNLSARLQPDRGEGPPQPHG